ncbi:hypothetical protein JW933_08460, partial [candidate division FCPU426 bacterium]|nr:hypothetical protein [candidate division FCPU426 bacterium]
AALKASGISYLSVKPRVTKQDLVNPYFSLLRNRQTPLEKLLSQNQNIFTVEPFLTQNADPHKKLNEATEMNLRERVFSRLAELLLVVKTVIYCFLEHKPGEDPQQKVPATLGNYGGRSEVAPVVPGAVKIFPGQAMSFTVSAGGQEQLLAVRMPEDRDLPISAAEALDVAEFAHETLAFMDKVKAPAVEAKLNSMPLKERLGRAAANAWLRVKSIAGIFWKTWTQLAGRPGMLREAQAFGEIRVRPMLIIGKAVLLALLAVWLGGQISSSFSWQAMVVSAGLSVFVVFAFYIPRLYYFFRLLAKPQGTEGHGILQAYDLLETIEQEWHESGGLPRNYQRPRLEWLQPPSRLRAWLSGLPVGQGKAGVIRLHPRFNNLPLWARRAVLQHEILESLGQGHVQGTAREYASVMASWFLRSRVQRRQEGPALSFASGAERQRVLDNLQREQHNNLAAYQKRYLQGLPAGRDRQQWNLSGADERLAQDVAFLRADRVFHEGLLKDQNQTYWILKKYELPEETADQRREGKNRPRQEHLAYLLLRAVANATPIRRLTPDEAGQLGLTGKPEDYYLTRVVATGNVHAGQTGGQDAGKAFARNFVANILLRKWDAHLLNMSFADNKPVLIDHDRVLPADRYPNTGEGFAWFRYRFLRHTVAMPLEHWADFQNYFGSGRRLPILDTLTAGEALSALQDILKQHGIGRAYQEAEMLTLKNIREAVQACKSIDFVRAAAETAGYTGPDLETVVQYFQENQQRLGRDVDLIWQALTGQDAGLAVLDVPGHPEGEAPTTAVAREREKATERKSLGQRLGALWQNQRNYWLDRFTLMMLRLHASRLLPTDYYQEMTRAQGRRGFWTRLYRKDMRDWPIPAGLLGANPAQFYTRLVETAPTPEIRNYLLWGAEAGNIQAFLIGKKPALLVLTPSPLLEALFAKGIFGPQARMQRRADGGIMIYQSRLAALTADKHFELFGRFTQKVFSADAAKRLEQIEAVLPNIIARLMAQEESAADGIYSEAVGLLMGFPAEEARMFARYYSRIRNIYDRLDKKPLSKEEYQVIRQFYQSMDDFHVINYRGRMQKSWTSRRHLKTSVAKIIRKYLPAVSEELLDAFVNLRVVTVRGGFYMTIMTPAGEQFLREMAAAYSDSGMAPAADSLKSRYPYVLTEPRWRMLRRMARELKRHRLLRSEVRAVEQYLLGGWRMPYARRRLFARRIKAIIEKYNMWLVPGSFDQQANEQAMAALLPELGLSPMKTAATLPELMPTEPQSPEQDETTGMLAEAEGRGGRIAVDAAGLPLPVRLPGKMQQNLQTIIVDHYIRENDSALMARSAQATSMYSCAAIVPLGIGMGHLTDKRYAASMTSSMGLVFANACLRSILPFIKHGEVVLVASIHGASRKNIENINIYLQQEHGVQPSWVHPMRSEQWFDANAEQTTIVTQVVHLPDKSLYLLYTSETLEQYYGAAEYLGQGQWRFHPASELALLESVNNKVRAQDAAAKQAGGLMPWLKALFVRAGMKPETYDRWVAWVAENAISMLGGVLVSIALIAVGAVSPEMLWKTGFLAAWPIFFILHFAQMLWKGRAPPKGIWIPALFIAGANAALLLLPLSLPIIFVASFVIHWWANQILSRTEVTFKQYLHNVFVRPWREFTWENIRNPRQFLLLRHNNLKPDRTLDYMKLIPRITGWVVMFGSMLALPFVTLAWLSRPEMAMAMPGAAFIILPIISAILGFVGLHAVYNVLTPWAQLSTADAAERLGKVRSEAFAALHKILSNQDEIDRIYADMLNAYGAGRYKDKIHDQPEAWDIGSIADLLNNRGSSAVIYEDHPSLYIKKETAGYSLSILQIGVLIAKLGDRILQTAMLKSTDIMLQYLLNYYYPHLKVNMRQCLFYAAGLIAGNPEERRLLEELHNLCPEGQGQKMSEGRFAGLFRTAAAKMDGPELADRLLLQTNTYKFMMAAGFIKQETPRYSTDLQPRPLNKPEQDEKERLLQLALETKSLLEPVKKAIGGEYAAHFVSRLQQAGFKDARFAVLAGIYHTVIIVNGWVIDLQPDRLSEMSEWAGQGFDTARLARQGVAIGKADDPAYYPYTFIERIALPEEMEQALASLEAKLQAAREAERIGLYLRQIPRGFDPDARVKLKCAVLDADDTLTEGATAKLEGENLAQVMRALKAGVKILIVSGAPLVERQTVRLYRSDNPRDYAEEAVHYNYDLKTRVVDVIREALRQEGREECLEHLTLKGIYGAETMTFDADGQEHYSCTGRLAPGQQRDFAKGLCLGYLRVLAGKLGKNFDRPIQDIENARNISEVKNIFQQAVKDFSAAKLGHFDSQLTLIRTGAEGGQAIEFSLTWLQEHGYDPERGGFFAGSGGSFATIGLYKKAGVAQDWIRQVPGDGAKLGAGDSLVDDFLDIDEALYFPFYLGQAVAGGLAGRRIVARNAQGQDNVKHVGSGLALRHFLDAADQQLTYRQLVFLDNRYALADLAENGQLPETRLNEYLAAVKSQAAGQEKRAGQQTPETGKGSRGGLMPWLQDWHVKRGMQKYQVRHLLAPAAELAAEQARLETQYQRRAWLIEALPMAVA